MSWNGSAVTPGTVSEKRLAIDLSVLWQELWRLVGEEVGDPSGSVRPALYCVSTSDMTADAMTKSMRTALGCDPRRVYRRRVGSGGEPAVSSRDSDL